MTRKEIIDILYFIFKGIVIIIMCMAVFYEKFLPAFILLVIVGSLSKSDDI